MSQNTTTKIAAIARIPHAQRWSWRTASDRGMLWGGLLAADREGLAQVRQHSFPAGADVGGDVWHRGGQFGQAVVHEGE
jgi:hypothetical protein